MSFGKVVLVVAFVLSGTGIGVSVSDASASASATPTGTGTLTCSIGGEVDFYPPLTQYGTLPNGPGYNQELAYFSLQLRDCTGPDSNTPQPNPTAAAMNGAGKVHLKDAVVPFMGHNIRVMGVCGIGYFPPSRDFRNAEIWTGGAPVKKSQTKLSVGVTGGHIDGTSVGSYSGDVSGTLNLTAESSDEYNSVCNDDGNGSISELTFDPSTSTVTIG